MKIRVISIVTAMLLLVSGCSQTKQSMQEQTTEAGTITEETLAENNEDEVEGLVQTETPVKNEEKNEQSTEDTLAEVGNTETALITLEQPPFEYYASGEVTAKENAPLTLNLLSEKANEIIDDDRWFVDNGLSILRMKYRIHFRGHKVICRKE